MSDERVMVRVEIMFVMALPPGSVLPSPQMEAIDSAALAIAGPVDILPGSKISVSRARSKAPRGKRAVRSRST